MGETEYRYLSRRRPKLGLRHALKTVVELSFPPSLYCACCGNIIDSTRTYSLCDHCMDHFRWDRSDGISSEDIKLIRCVSYGIYERSLIFDLKYRGKKHVA